MKKADLAALNLSHAILGNLYSDVKFHIMSN